MVFERYILDYMYQFDRLHRPFWNYEDGCVLIGAQDMYEATNDEYYLNSIKNFMDRYLEDDGNIRFYDLEEYNIDRIPPGRVLFLLYEKTGNEIYRKAIELLMDQLRTHPRTECGSFWHKKIYPYQIWLDGLYMGLPYYLLYENRFGGGDQYEDIVQQFQNTRKYLYDEEAQLYYHAYDEKKEMFWADKETGLSANFWSRAMGWYLMALIDCYELMPKEKESLREQLSALLTEAINGMLKYLDKKSGLFYQLTALPDVGNNYLETSASAMVAYTLLKGVRLSVFDEAYYRPIGEEILIALETCKFKIEHGVLALTGMCKGAGLGPADNHYRDGSVAYYLSEPAVADEQKGVGACMMAYSEWLRLKNQGRIGTLDYPQVFIYKDIIS